MMWFGSKESDRKCHRRGLKSRSSNPSKHAFYQVYLFLPFLPSSFPKVVLLIVALEIWGYIFVHVCLFSLNFYRTDTET